MKLYILDFRSRRLHTILKYLPITCSSLLIIMSDYFVVILTRGKGGVAVVGIIAGKGVIVKLEKFR